MCKCSGWTDSRISIHCSQLSTVYLTIQNTILASVFRFWFFVLLPVVATAYIAVAMYLICLPASLTCWRLPLVLLLLCFIDIIIQLANACLLFQYWFGKTMDLVRVCVYFRTNLHRFKRQYIESIDVWCTVLRRWVRHCLSLSLTIIVLHYSNFNSKSMKNTLNKMPSNQLYANFSLEKRNYSFRKLCSVILH